MDQTWDVFDTVLDQVCTPTCITLGKCNGPWNHSKHKRGCKGQLPFASIITCLFVINILTACSNKAFLQELCHEITVNYVCIHSYGHSGGGTLANRSPKPYFSTLLKYRNTVRDILVSTDTLHAVLIKIVKIQLQGLDLL